MTDLKREFRPPWQITHEMFLSEEEVQHLLQRLTSPPGDAASRQGALAARDRLLRAATSVAESDDGTGTRAVLP